MDLFDNNDYDINSYNEDLSNLIRITKRQWKTMLLASISLIIILMLIGYFAFSTMFDKKLDEAYKIYQDATNDFKRVYYLPENYSTAALSVSSTRLDSVLEINCSTKVVGSTITSSASGIVITQDGYVITNNHVVTYEKDVPVYNGFGGIARYEKRDTPHTKITANFIESSAFYAEKGYELELIELFKDQDLALLKFKKPPSGLKAAPFGNSALVSMGEDAIIIGNAQNYGLALTMGVISNPSRLFIEAETNKSLNVLQTDAALNPGNSGGPVFNIYGEIIGVVSFKVKATEINEGLGFAVLSNIVIEFINTTAANKHLTINYKLTERGEDLAA